MNFDTLEPYLLGLCLFAVTTLIGIWPVKKLITVYEAKHELKQGSAGLLRALSGWVWIAFWIMATWFCATILGDWATHGDFAGAMDRAALRLHVLMEIAATLGDG